MSEADATNPRQNRWRALALFIVGLGMILLALKVVADLIEKEVKSTAAIRELNNPQKPPVMPGRATFTGSVQDLVDRYNQNALELDRSLLLPPANALESAGSNDKFHGLRHAVKPMAYVSIEVDNVSGKPFSLGLWAGARNNSEVVSLMAIEVAIGAAIFGKGDNAGILVKQCAKSANAKGNPVSVKVEGFEVFCSNTTGIWIAGISVADNRPNPEPK